MSEETPRNSAPERDFEDLSLAEALRELRRAPGRTLKAFASVTNPRRKSSGYRVTASSTAVQSDSFRVWLARIMTPARIRLTLYLLGLLLLWFVDTLYVRRLSIDSSRLQFTPYTDGVPLTILGAVLIMVAELYVWRVRRRARAMQQAAGDPAEPLATDQRPFPQWAADGAFRPISFFIGAGLAAAAYTLNSGNLFTPLGVVTWFASIALIAHGFAPRDVNPMRTLKNMGETMTRFTLENRGVVLAIIVITLAGAAFRFQNLDTVPPEMTSDHLEKILDSERVLRGETNVFFQGNGGREPLQMYLIALYTQITGAPNDFMAAKTVATLEGIIGLPVMFLLGVTVIGPRDRRLGILLGIALMIVVAFGYWHNAIGRVSLRIILTPLITSVVLIFLIRGIRFNRRADWIWAGLALGAGLYMYQAVRMVPVVAIAAAALAFFGVARTWTQRRVVLFNFCVLVIISFVVFVPLFRFSVQYPNDFWRRSSGRLFGDDLIQETMADGTVLERTATLDERLQAFQANLPILGSNIINALLMFNYRGDIIFLHNAPTFPAYTPLMGALFFMGMLLWAFRLARKRDAGDALMFVTLFIMLLPSALSIASPNENPSHTRTSGAMPSAYLLAAYGLTMLTLRIRDVVPVMWRSSTVFAVLVLCSTSFYMTDSDVLFNAYRNQYIASWKPLSEGGKMLRGFAESDGAYGNAFMFSFAHGWDYRIVAVEGGLPPGYWTNGDIPLERMPQAIANAFERAEVDPLKLDPERDLLFILDDADQIALAQLEQWFPDGRMSRWSTYAPNVYFRTYRVPALGREGLIAFLRAQGIDL